RPDGALNSARIRGGKHSNMSAFSTRRSYRQVALAAALGGAALLAACQQPNKPAPIVVAPRATEPAPVATTVAPTPAPTALAGRPQYQMNAQHTGRSPYSGPNAPRLLRSFDSAAMPVQAPGDPRPEIQSSAAIAPDGTIYVGTFRGTLLALRDPGTGD